MSDPFEDEYCSTIEMLNEEINMLIKTVRALEGKLELAIEALESISIKEYHCLCNHACKEALEKLK